MNQSLIKESVELFINKFNDKTDHITIQMSLHQLSYISDILVKWLEQLNEVITSENELTPEMIENTKIQIGYTVNLLNGFTNVIENSNIPEENIQ